MRRVKSDRRGFDRAVSYESGDYIDLAEAIPPADIVTLERVLNVYPDWERLAAVSAGHARRLFGVVVPRDRLFVKGMIGLINLRLRLQGKSVRARVIPVAELGASFTAKASPRIPSKPLDLRGWSRSFGDPRRRMGATKRGRRQRRSPQEPPPRRGRA